MIRRVAQPAPRRTTRVIEVAPRSVMRVAVTTGAAMAVSIAVATACLVAVAGVTGVHRPIDRMFTSVQRGGHHMSTSELIAAAGAALAVIALVVTVLVGALVALFANHVLPLTGGVSVDEEDPAPTP